MKKQYIPEISFQNRQRKAFEFEIISADELLHNNAQRGHNSYRPNRLAFYAILFIQEGQGQHFIDFKQYEFNSRSMIFIAKDQVHAFAKQVNMKAQILLFTESFLLKTGFGRQSPLQLSLFQYHLYQPLMQLSEDHFKSIETVINRLKYEYSTSQDFATEEIIVASLKILLYLAERFGQARSDQKFQPYYLEEFNTFQHLLQQNLLQNRSVQFYANQLNISSKTLNRITQEIIQKQSKTYIDEMLILEIKRFLMNTALSIKEIGYKTGFNDPTNFVKFFKKYTKTTPASFRKQFQ